MTVERLTWPAERLAEAFEHLARAARGAPPDHAAPSLPEAVVRGEAHAVERWLEHAAASLEVEVEPVSTSVAELTPVLSRGGPALLRIGRAEPRYLVVLRSRGRRVRCLGPDLRVHREDPEAIRSALCSHLEQPLGDRIEHLLRTAHVPKNRQAKAQKALVSESLSQHRLHPGWLVRLPPRVSIWRQLAADRQHLRLATVSGCHLVQHLLMILGWALIGRGALLGRLDVGWLLGWGALILSILPIQLATVHQQGRLLLRTSLLLKRRLLAGVLRLEPEEVRHDGAGQLLGRVFETEALESLLLGGGHLAVLSTIELIAAAAVLTLGAGGSWHALLFVGWVAVVILLSVRLFRARTQWAEARLEVTNDLIEQMVGHRTRLVQQRPERWHEGEDRLLVQYLRTALRLNRIRPLLDLAPRAWRLLGVAGLIAPFTVGNATTTGLAVAVGGVLLGSRALSRLTGGISDLSAAAIAWQRIEFLYRAAGRTGPTNAALLDPGTQDRTLMVARDITYHYPSRHRLVLDEVKLQVRRGDQILLLGPSGGGKSTLAALLAGIRSHHDGLMLLHGLDRTSLGLAQWRSSVVMAPQFHENHVLTDTFAFNLLMGRGWPPRPGDLEDAEEVCRELGLDQLLAKMPSGMEQMVGESGWQLSHGEQGRLFIARAILQRPELLVLDESFGALDPESLAATMECVRRRAPTLIVIAHP